MSFVTHLESAIDGTHLDPNIPQTTHADRPLWVRYDVEAVGGAVNRDQLRARPASMWRYRELLPLDGDPVGLGETTTPLVRCERLGAELGLSNLWVKDESRLPTGSFKARGLAMAVNRARELGLRRLAIPTAGNAGGALGAYAARAGMEAWIFMPKDTPAVNQLEAGLFGARAFRIDGLITDCGAVVRDGTEPMGWFDVSTLKEPYRIEGKKTMGLELADQFDWTLPDVILYPTGGGTGLVGMWKAFAELDELGWLDAPHKPRMVACQAAGCAPIVRAWEAGERFAEPVTGAHTVASGLRVPAAVGDFMILDAIRASGGLARAVPDEDLLAWTRRASALEGISFCPEAGACLAALAELAAEGAVSSDERIVVFNTGAGQKYVEALTPELPLLDTPVDWDALAG